MSQARSSVNDRDSVEPTGRLPEEVADQVLAGFDLAAVAANLATPTARAPDELPLVAQDRESEYLAGVVV